MPVPCGKCPDCRAHKVSAWSFRLMQEEKKARSAQFVTLTYDTSHVPISGRGFMNLDKRDVQLFMKRLRKAHGTACQIKYYLAGEYGETNWRPHYHVILFNAKMELIQPAWEKGSVHYGTVSGASVGYTLKYISKPSKIPVHKNDDRQREFSLMSKGLGKSYINENTIHWHKSDLENRMYLNLKGGQKITMPRYFKEKIYTAAEREIIAQASTVKIMDKYAKDWQSFDENTIPNKKAGIKAAYDRMHQPDKTKKL